MISTNQARDDLRQKIEKLIIDFGVGTLLLQDKLGDSEDTTEDERLLKLYVDQIMAEVEAYAEEKSQNLIDEINQKVIIPLEGRSWLEIRADLLLTSLTQVLNAERKKLNAHSRPPEGGTK